MPSPGMELAMVKRPRRLLLRRGRIRLRLAEGGRRFLLGRLHLALVRGLVRRLVARREHKRQPAGQTDPEQLTLTVGWGHGVFSLFRRPAAACRPLAEGGHPPVRKKKAGAPSGRRCAGLSRSDHRPGNNALTKSAGASSSPAIFWSPGPGARESDLVRHRWVRRFDERLIDHLDPVGPGPLERGTGRSRRRPACFASWHPRVVSGSSFPHSRRSPTRTRGLVVYSRRRA